MNPSLMERVPEFDMDQSGAKVLQLSIGMHLFFKGPFASVRARIGQTWQRYLALVGKDTLTWARLGGGNRSRPVDASVLRTVDNWLGAKGGYGDTIWISIHDGAMDRLGRRSFMVTGFDRPVDWQEQASFVTLNLPLALWEKLGSAQLARELAALAEPAPFSSGVAGLAFHRSPYKFSSTIQRMGQLGMRYQGVEIAAAERLSYVAINGITSVNWLTFVGDEWLGRLGGADRLADKLPPECPSLALPRGVVVCSGPDPILGDRNEAQDGLEHMRSTYQALAAVLATDTEIPFSSVSFNSDQTLKWITRLG